MLRDTLRTPFRTLTFGALGALIISLAAPFPAQAQSLDELGRPDADMLGSLEDVTNQDWVPSPAQSALKKAIEFFRGTGEPGVDIPQDAGPIAQFAWPTIMSNCIAGTQDSVGTALAVPGPSPLPVPGVPAGQVAFVFTALGTGTVAEEQATQMTVNWLNINNGRSGITELAYTGINPEGPATVNGLADTGPGTVFMLLQGGVTTNLDDGATSTCTTLPTAGTVSVR